MSLVCLGDTRIKNKSRFCAFFLLLVVACLVLLSQNKSARSTVHWHLVQSFPSFRQRPTIPPTREAAFQVVDGRNGSQLVLLTAYADRRRPGANGAYLKAVVALKSPYPLQIRCHIFFKDGRSHEAKAEKDVEYHWRVLVGYVRYDTAVVSCRNPTGKFPQHLSLSTPGGGSDARATKVPVFGMPAAPPVDNLSLHSCVAPMTRWNKTDRLVEWIEMNRLLGVQNFTIYIHSVSKAVARVLELYRLRGLVKLVPWKLPSVIPVATVSKWPPVGSHLYYGGQIGAYNDCFLRNMHRAKWIMATDLDEMIVPRPAAPRTLPAILQRVSESKRVTYLFDQYAFDIRQRKPGANASGLFFPAFVKRMPSIDPNLCKAIHLAAGVEKVGVHNLFRSTDAYRDWGSTRVSADIASLHHYRKVPATVTDEALTRFTQPLLRRFLARKKEFDLT